MIQLRVPMQGVQEPGAKGTWLPQYTFVHYKGQSCLKLIGKSNEIVSIKYIPEMKYFKYLLNAILYVI